MEEFSLVAKQKTSGFTIVPSFIRCN